MSRAGPVRAPGVDPKQFGHIPGVLVGTHFSDRAACSRAGVHAPLQAGIHGSSQVGAYSVALSGGYPDDMDSGDIITYTGAGGRDYYKDELARMQNKRSFDGRQTADQTWTRVNLALKLSWENKTPVRVIRGASLDSPFAPAQGYRYDGLYTVTKAFMAPGKEGFKMCKFIFERCPGQPQLLSSPAIQAEDVELSHTVTADVDNSKDVNASSSNASMRVGPPVGVRLQQPIASVSETKVEDFTSRPRKSLATRPKLQSSLMKKVSAEARTKRHFMPENRLIKRTLTDMQPKVKREDGRGCRLSDNALIRKA